MGDKKKKKKKQKITYIDDGRTIVDMSGTSKPNAILGNRPSGKNNMKRGTAKEQFNTYMSAVRQMFVPMLVVMGIITVAFVVMYLLFVYGA